MSSTIFVWVAQGFGIGRVPWAPGTFGSIVGVLWALTLIATKSVWGYVAGMIAGIAIACWICHHAEKILESHDPPSVVLDEIAALPIAFLPWVLIETQATGKLPAPEFFVSGKNAWITSIIFALFRLSDIAKPPPVRASQRLPGGFGVVADDVLAAVYVAIATLLVLR